MTPGAILSLSAELKQLRSRIDQLEQQVASQGQGEALVPTYLSVDQFGNVSANFNGVVTAKGLSLTEQSRSIVKGAVNLVDWLDSGGNLQEYISGQSFFNTPALHGHQLELASSPAARGVRLTLIENDGTLPTGSNLNVIINGVTYTFADDNIGRSQGSFSALITSASLANDTVIPFDTIDYDSSLWFNTTTHRFQPTIPGYYNFNANVYITNLVAGKFARLFLRRSGSTVRVGRPEITASDALGASALVLNATAHANGTTDYFELMVDHNNTSNVSLVGTSNSPTFTYWQGRLEAQTPS